MHPHARQSLAYLRRLIAWLEAGGALGAAPAAWWNRAQAAALAALCAAPVGCGAPQEAPDAAGREDAGGGDAELGDVWTEADGDAWPDPAHAVYSAPGCAVGSELPGHAAAPISALALLAILKRRRGPS